jgi:hypothetical protein
MGRSHDLTSTFFECDPPDKGKRKHGYSRDKRQDCVQVVIALIKPKFLETNRSFSRRFNCLRLKRAARRWLCRDCGGKIEGLPLL